MSKETKKEFFARLKKEKKEKVDKEDKAGSFAKQQFIAKSKKISDLEPDFVAKGSPHKDNIKLAGSKNITPTQRMSKAKQKLKKGGMVKGYMGGGEVEVAMDDSPNSGMITTKGFGASRKT